MSSGFGNPKRANLIVANSLAEIAAAGAAAQLAARGNLGLGTSDTAQFSKLGLGVANSLGRLDLATHTTNAGGIWFGSDVNLFRSAGDTLQTDDEIRSARASGANGAFGARVFGDVVNRVEVRADGSLAWSSGALAADVNLYRSAADVLSTDDAFLAGLNLHARNGLPEQVAIGNVGPASQAGCRFGTGTDAMLYKVGAGIVGVVGTLQLGVAYAAGAPAATGTLTVRDSAGTAYRLLCAI